MRRYPIILFSIVILVFWTQSYLSAQNNNSPVLVGFCADIDDQCDKLRQVIWSWIAENPETDVYLVDVTDPDWPRIKLGLYNLSWSVTESQTPIIFVGNQKLTGFDEIKRELSTLQANTIPAFSRDILAVVPEISSYKLTLPQVHAAYFFSPDLADWAIRQEILEPLVYQNSRLHLHLADLSHSDNLFFIETLYSQIPSVPLSEGLPILVMGEQVLMGARQIEASAENMLTSALSEGTEVKLPDWIDNHPLKWCDGNCPSDKTVWSAYFSDSLDTGWDLIDLQLAHLSLKNPQFKVDKFEYALHKELAWQLAELTGNSLKLPALFIGDKALFAEEINPEKVQGLIDQYQTTGTQRIWLRFITTEESETQEIEVSNIWNLFRTGLSAGFNPINISTVILLLFLLKLVKASPRFSMAMGLYLSLGSFLTNTLYVTGIMPVNISQASYLAEISLWTSRLLTIICALLAIYSMIELVINKTPSQDVNKLQFKTRREPSSINIWLMGIPGILIGALLPLIHYYQIQGAMSVLAATHSVAFMSSKLAAIILNAMAVLPVIGVAGLGYWVGQPGMTKLQNRLPLIKSSLQALIFAGLAIWLYNLIDLI